ncbi:MAG: hypothetical protein ABIP91_06250 [Sphingomicrobium sp.]
MATRDPVPDPLPTPRQALLRRFGRIMRLMALFSIAVAALAVVLVARGDEGLHIHMLIATALGVGLSVLLAGALMSLIFLSHDEMPRRHDAVDRDRERP